MMMIHVRAVEIQVVPAGIVDALSLVYVGQQVRDVVRYVVAGAICVICGGVFHLYRRNKTRTNRRKQQRETHPCTDIREIRGSIERPCWDEFALSPPRLSADGQGFLWER